MSEFPHTCQCNHSALSGGMLTGDEIEEQIKSGNIVIDPYDPKRINPNSYNLRLHPQLLIYTRGIDRSCEIPTGEADPIIDFVNRETNRLNHSIKTIKQPVYKRVDNGDGTVSMQNTGDKEFSIPIFDYNSDVNDELRMKPIDMKKQNETICFDIPETGYVLRPGVLYIGRTVERTFTDKFIPMLDGRSSGGRLGISIHICAGFGDIGFDGTWTLEITVVEPVIVYPNVEIAQVSYFNPCGKTDRLYSGRYNKQEDATASRFWKG